MPDDDRFSTHLTPRELATVLAAMRYFQQYLAENDGPISEHFDSETPLTVEEIDDLCERLNCDSTIAGPAAGHGPAWKAIAIRLGATPRACEKSHEAAVKPGDWQATCTACKKIFHRYKRPKSLSGYRCRCEARRT